MKRILGWFVALVFLLGMVFLTIPDVYRCRIVNVLIRADASTRRRTETYWQLFWARFYHRLILSLANIQMPIRILGEIPPGPYVFVMNHRTALDGPLFAAVTRKLGVHHVLWIVKEDMRKAPVLGGSFERSGYAFVTRANDPGDKERVRAMAELANQDGASLAIFPEGTRYTGTEEERKSYDHLRDPKRGGLQAYMDACPGYPIIFICMDWRGLRGGKTIWDGDGLLGLRGQVSVWHMPLVPGDNAESVLAEGWERMDELLGSRPRLQLVRSDTQA